MLRTTSKQVKEQLKEHVLNRFTPESYGNNDTSINNLNDQLSALSHLPSAYAQGFYMAEGGTWLVYDYDKREFLESILEQSTEESSKYDDFKVHQTYCHLLARTVAELAHNPVKQGA